MYTSVFSALLLGFSLLVSAAPTPPHELLAFGPTITSPTSGTVWDTGSSQQVTWETDNIPTEAQNYTLTIFLGHLNNGSLNEHLDIKHPLATNVTIMSGVANVTVPNTKNGTNYVVAAIGEASDISPQFTIVSN